MKKNETISRLTNFLLPIDDSDASKNAINFAGVFINEMNNIAQKFTLLYVCSGQYLKSSIANIDMRSIHLLESSKFQEIRDNHLKKNVSPIFDNAKKLLNDIGFEIPVQQVILDGEPAKEIAHHAKEENYSTIIIGKKDRAHFRNLSVGSVGMSLLHMDLNQSVYVVGSKYEKEKNLIPNILIPIDGSQYSMNAVYEAVEIIKNIDSEIEKIILLNVLNSADYAKIVLKDEKIELDSEKNISQAEKIILDSGIDKNKLDVLVEFGDPADIICKTADDKDVNLIMMGRKGRSAMHDLFMGSVSNEILIRCTKPIVAIISD